MQIAHLLIVGLFGTVVPLQPLFADADAEREALARIAHELEAFEPLIQTAESQAEPDRRIRFRYDWLRKDLSRVRQGILEHIDAPRAEPRTFPPLRADYRR
ncbi:RAQPRD family integrative conjugative element protein [Sedimenticola selenatireducens]|uniref:integrative conjugative element protein, RAQPRD family n=1 Tax=Sedimenticola selenatireducens TaxID=191960 RepID=UPI0004B413C9|nr:RAQPRD family integrative conjugative element protein [Sedimenticola selenatireducens]